MKKSQDLVKRSFIKTISYRILIIISTYFISLLITGDQRISIGITSVSSVANTFLYFVHERFWNAVKWGRNV